MYCNKLYHWQK